VATASPSSSYRQNINGTQNMLVSRQYRLNRLKTLNLLKGLEATGTQAVSIYLPPGLAEADTRELLDNALPAQDVLLDTLEMVVLSPTGSAVFWGSSQKLLIRPPFPLVERFISADIDTEPLCSLLESSCTVALILVRLGAFTIGVCRDEQLVTSKTGTGLVHGRHRKGGSSQRRFERRRENQAREFLERVCGHARQQLEPHVKDIDYLIYGGARTTIQSLRKQCPFLSQFEDRTLLPMLNIPRPRRAVLEEAVTEVWSSTITEWHDKETSEI
jgi:peptide subunit release factor 1 (eRF1)